MLLQQLLQSINAPEAGPTVASGGGRIADDFELEGEQLTFVIGLAFPQGETVRTWGFRAS